MNYLKTYIKLVKKAKNRELPEGTYVEKHHVFPVSIFGRKGNKNIVKLTYKEHLVAHHLLYSACLKRYGAGHYRTIKMARALYGVINLAKKTKCVSNMLVAARLRNRKGTELISGANNPFYGKNHTEETKKNISKKRKGANNPNWGKRGKGTTNYGNTHTEEMKRKWSEKRKGENNGRFDSTVYAWENIHTGERDNCTAYSLEKNYGLCSGRVSNVKNGKAEHTRGWMCMGVSNDTDL